MEIREMKRVMPFTTWRYLEPDDELAASILETRYGKEVFTEVLWLVAGLFVCEMIIARKRRYIKESNPKNKIPNPKLT